MQITDDELDRSVATNLPVDPTKDNRYQAYRRALHLPDTDESLAKYRAEIGDLSESYENVDNSPNKRTHFLFGASVKKELPPL